MEALKNCLKNNTRGRKKGGLGETEDWEKGRESRKKGEEMDGRVGSQERERESERRMVNEKKGSLILKTPALHHNYRPKIPKNNCQTE